MSLAKRTLAKSSSAAKRLNCSLQVHIQSQAFSQDLVEPLANVFKSLGSHHVMVVNAEDGLDEISIAADTQVAELKDGQVTTWTIKPEDYGCRHASLDDIRVENADESLEMVCSVFTNKPGPAMDIVLLNAGAAIYVAGLTDSIEAGIERAREIIASEKAAEKFADLIALSNQLAVTSE